MLGRKKNYSSFEKLSFFANSANFLAVLLVAIWIGGCSPSDATPGQWLRGNAVDRTPDDWSFTDEFKEIYIEVKTPYFIPHSVTIWCAQVKGKLFIGARDPESKNWPGWVDKNGEVRLKIGENIYAVAASPLSDEAAVAPVRAAYSAKYDLPPPTDDAPSTMRYWAIVDRN